MTCDGDVSFAKFTKKSITFCTLCEQKEKNTVIMETLIHVDEKTS